MKEDQEDRLDRFEGALGELRGRLAALDAQVMRLYDKVTAPAPERGSGWKTAITFASLVIVPILVALLGGYFALRAAGLR